MSTDLATTSRVQCLLRPAAGRSHAAFARQAHAVWAPRVSARCEAPITLHVTEAPPRVSIVPLRRAPLALLTIEDGEAGPQVEASLEAFEGRATIYEVESSTPVAIDCAPRSGERTPGVGLLTLMVKHPRLSDAAFMEEWHGVHTPLAISIHPYARYERNVVRARVRGADAFDGLVLEHFRRRRDLLNPARFFGGALRMVSNMARVGLHVRRFLDLSRIENYLVVEHVVAPA